jgi:hypothetical protein
MSKGRIYWKFFYANIRRLRHGDKKLTILSREYLMYYRGPGFSCHRTLWLFPPATPSCLSFSVFLCVAGRAYWRERGEGREKEPNHSPTRKPRPLLSINCSLLQSLLYKGQTVLCCHIKVGIDIEYDCQLALPDPGQLSTAARGEDLAAFLPDNLLIKNTKRKKLAEKVWGVFPMRFSKQKW